jgi:hypothetical protein
VASSAWLSRVGQGAEEFLQRGRGGIHAESPWVGDSKGQYPNHPGLRHIKTERPWADLDGGRTAGMVVACLGIFQAVVDAPRVIEVDNTRTAVGSFHTARFGAGLPCRTHNAQRAGGDGDCTIAYPLGSLCFLPC